MSELLQRLGVLLSTGAGAILSLLLLELLFGEKFLMREVTHLFLRKMKKK